MTSPTRRSVDRRIGAIAIPAAIALATEPLFELCDVAILGHLGTDELGGASLAIRLLAFGHAVFIFLMFGTTSAVARRLGAGDRVGAAREAVTAMWIALAIGLVGTAAFLASGRVLLTLLGGTGAVADPAWTYLWINAFGLAGFTLTMAGVGVRRGMLETRTPLVVAAIAAAVNLVADLVLVVGLGFGVGAAALTTTAVKIGSAVFYVTLVAGEARRQRVSLLPRRLAASAQLRVGRDLVIRTLLLRGAIMAAQSMAAHRGPTQLAAFAITFQIWMFCAYAADGLEAAGQSLVAHERGAAAVRDAPPHRSSSASSASSASGASGATAEATAVADHASLPLRLLVARLNAWGLRLGVVLTLLLLTTSAVLPRLFTTDADVAAAAMHGLWWVGAFSVINTLAFVGDGILVGAGRQQYLAAAMGAAAIAFAVVAWAGRSNADLAIVWAAISAMMATRCVAAFVGVRRFVMATQRDDRHRVGSPAN
ncbi:MAG: MATE family efflux transporter [Actinobacteria bacterium]|nr:MATE family efflux transporter [Actinomycetota bacterium]